MNNIKKLNEYEEQNREEDYENAVACHYLRCRRWNFLFPVATAFVSTLPIVGVTKSKSNLKSPVLLLN